MMIIRLGYLKPYNCGQIICIEYKCLQLYSRVQTNRFYQIGMVTNLYDLVQMISTWVE